VLRLGWASWLNLPLTSTNRGTAPSPRSGPAGGSTRFAAHRRPWPRTSDPRTGSLSRSDATGRSGRSVRRTQPRRSTGSCGPSVRPDLAQPRRAGSVASAANWRVSRVSRVLRVLRGPRVRTRGGVGAILRLRAARTRGVAAQHASLSRWRSPVRIRSGPPLISCLRLTTPAHPAGVCDSPRPMRRPVTPTALQLRHPAVSGSPPPAIPLGITLPA
jgi:hypothetical protein